MIRSLAYGVINSFKDFAKVLLKKNSKEQGSPALPLLIAFINILPFAFFPIFMGKPLIYSEYSLIYVLLLLPLSGIIVFFHSLSLKSNTLCILGVKAGIQSLAFALLLLFCMVSVAMNYSSLNIQVIASSSISLKNMVVELPIALLYFTMLLIRDRGYLTEYSRQYSGILSSLLTFSDRIIPLKELVIFSLLFLGGENSLIKGGSPNFVWLLLKVVLCLVAYKGLSINIPKLRTDQIIEIFLKWLLVIGVVWLVIKALILFFL